MISNDVSGLFFGVKLNTYLSNYLSRELALVGGFMIKLAGTFLQSRGNFI